MNTYNLPRNVKGEGRILFIFSTKALIYTAIGAGVGIIFYIIFTLLGVGYSGLVIMGIFGLIGFIIGTFKIPNSNVFELTRKTRRRKHRRCNKKVGAIPYAWQKSICISRYSKKS